MLMLVEYCRLQASAASGEFYHSSLMLVFAAANLARKRHSSAEEPDQISKISSIYIYIVQYNVLAKLINNWYFKPNHEYCSISNREGGAHRSSYFAEKLLLTRSFI